MLKDEEPVVGSIAVVMSLVAAHSYATRRMCDDIIVINVIKLDWMLRATSTTACKVFEYQQSRKGGGAWQRDGGSLNKDPRAHYHESCDRAPLSSAGSGTTESPHPVAQLRESS